MSKIATFKYIRRYNWDRLLRPGNQTADKALRKINSDLRPFQDNQARALQKLDLSAMNSSAL
jgi:hypothetical protein